MFDFDFENFVVWVCWVIISLTAGITGFFVWHYMDETWQGTVVGVACAFAIGWYGVDFVRWLIRRS